MIVSIIIPVYEVAPYIEDCLRSVMRQTYTGAMECLIVDDCGTDESIFIAERMIAEYDGPIRFVILHHEKNQGVSAARNTGMKKAVGDYIIFIDSDDEFTEDCLEKMMMVVRDHPEIELVQGSTIWHYQNGEKAINPKVIKIVHAESNDEVRSCFYGHEQVSLVAWNKLMKHSLIKDSNLSFIEELTHEDIPWVFYLLKYVNNAWFLSDVTYHYKLRPNSIITGKDKYTKYAHMLKGYHEIFTHLTPGYETQELEHFAPSYIWTYRQLSYRMPELTEDLKIIWHHAWVDRNYKRCVALAICYVFRRTKWLGRIYSFAMCLVNPGQIPKVFARLRH